MSSSVIGKATASFAPSLGKVFKDVGEFLGCGQVKAKFSAKVEEVDNACDADKCRNPVFLAPPLALIAQNLS
jgi:hypothetical protein